MPDLFYRDNLAATSRDALKLCLVCRSLEKIEWCPAIIHRQRLSAERHSNIDGFAPRKDTQGYSNSRHSSAICRTDMALTLATDGQRLQTLQSDAAGQRDGVAVVSDWIDKPDWSDRSAASVCVSAIAVCIFEMNAMRRYHTQSI